MRHLFTIRFIVVIITFIALGLFTATAYASSFTSFVIRNGSTSGNPPTIQSNTDYVPNALEFIISESGMKAGWGSNDLNGYAIGQIQRLAITRYDDTTRFTPGSGPAVAPYFNIWVTDGTNYAVVANEPSNPAFQSLFTSNPDGSKSYDLSFADLTDKVAKVYETPGAGTGTSWVHTAVGKTSLTFADLTAFMIAPPPASYITDPTNQVGSGAPDELGTNVAYGFNWVFGDTLSNYVSGAEGYIVSNPVADPVPVPGAVWLLGSGLLGMVGLRRKFNK